MIILSSSFMYAVKGRHSVSGGGGGSSFGTC